MKKEIFQNEPGNNKQKMPPHFFYPCEFIFLAVTFFLSYGSMSLVVWKSRHKLYGSLSTDARLSYVADFVM